MSPTLYDKLCIATTRSIGFVNTHHNKRIKSDILQWVLIILRFCKHDYPIRSFKGVLKSAHGIIEPN